MVFFRRNFGVPLPAILGDDGAPRVGVEDGEPRLANRFIIAAVIQF
jgi:hypothetical protein